MNKALIGTTIHRTFNVLSPANTTEGTPETIAKALDNSSGLTWAYASVEVPDSSKDIVRIKGIDWSEYHRPGQTCLKILAQHERSSPTTGEDFIVGIAKSLKTVTTQVDGTGVAALAIGWEWATEYADVPLFQETGLPQVNEDGTQKTARVKRLTPLAATYKGRWEAGTLDSVSVGMIVKDYEDIPDGGYDFTKTSLIELSIVSLPANAYANGAGKGLDEAAINQNITEKFAEIEKKHLEAQDQICKASQSVEGLLKSLSSEITKSFVDVNDRLDAIESGIVVTSAVPSLPVTNDRNREAVQRAVQDIRQTLSKFAGR